MSDQSEDNQFSVGDILWEYADFDPIEPEPVPQEPAPVAPRQPVMPSPQPVAPAKEPETPAPKPRVINPDLPANAAPGQPAKPTPKPAPPKPAPSQGTPSAAQQTAGQGSAPAAKPDPDPKPNPNSDSSPNKNPDPTPAPAPKPQQGESPAPEKTPEQTEGQAPAGASQPSSPPAGDETPATPHGPTGLENDPSGGPELIGFTPDPAEQAPAQPTPPPQTGGGEQATAGTPSETPGPAPGPETAPTSPGTETPTPPPGPKPGPTPGPGSGPAPGPVPGPGGGKTTAGEAKSDEKFRLRRERKPRPQPETPPDATPTHLASEYALGLVEKKNRAIGSIVTSAILLVLALLDNDMIPFVGGILPTNLLILGSGALFLLCVWLCRDVLAEGMTQLTNKSPTEHTLVLFATLFTLADGITLLLSQLRTESLPFFAPCGLVLTCHFCGMYLTQAGNLQACRVAASVDQLYLVTQDPNVLGGKPSYRKWLSRPRGFGSQIRTVPDGLWRFRRLVPVLLTACFCLSLITTVAHGQPRLVFWSLSALFTASATLSAPLAFSLGFHLVGRKLAKVGAALAGWPGVLAGRGCRSVLLQDYDIYPPGTITLTTAQVFSNLAMERVVSYAASLIRASGSGLTFLFDKMLQAEKGGYLNVEKLTLQDNGLLGLCQGQQVLVGNSDFMSRMGVSLPSGFKSKDTIFCAVGGTAVGAFGLRYNLHPAILPALRALFAHGISPVMVTRDFNLSPQRLRLRGRLPVDQLTFPDLQRRVILSTPGQNHGGTIAAVLCREGLAPYSQAVIGAKRLRWTSRFSGLLSLVGACIGVFLTATLSSSAAMGAMCAWNLSVYLLLWLVPVVVLAAWSRSY